MIVEARFRRQGGISGNEVEKVEAYGTINVSCLWDYHSQKS